MSLSSKLFISLLTVGVMFAVGVVAVVHIINTQTADGVIKNFSKDTPVSTEASSNGKVMQIDGSFVSPDGQQPLDKNESSIQAPAPRPAITATSYLVGNIDTGEIYISKNPDTVSPVASMSKLMTAIVATDSMSPTTTIEITPEETDVPPDGSNLYAGEKFELKDLLYPMLLDSSNVAAEAIASSTNRLAFLAQMSGSAWEVNMPNAYFADPTGLSPHNEASANGIFSLAKYLYDYRPDILAITRIPHMEVATTTDHGSHSFDSIHPFVTDPRFIGGKTGRTPEAGETMLTIMNINDQPIAIVIMHASYGERAADTGYLIKKYESMAGVATR